MNAFAYTAARDGQVFISWNGRRVTTLAGAPARRFLDAARSAGPEAEQLLMARATGNFKRGNER